MSKKYANNNFLYSNNFLKNKKFFQLYFSILNIFMQFIIKLYSNYLLNKIYT